MATKKQGITGEMLLQILESRLDNVVFRLGLANTRREARQIVNHGHITVNGQKVDIPSYLVKPGDVIAVREKSKNSVRIKEIVETNANRVVPKWLSMDKNTLTGKVITLAARDDIDYEVEEHLIVELYSKKLYVTLGTWIYIYVFSRDFGAQTAPKSSLIMKEGSEMIEMEKPNIECVEMSDDGRYGKFVVSPLERGYCTTLDK